MVRFKFSAMALGVACIGTVLSGVVVPAIAQDLSIGLESTVTGTLETGDIQLSRDDSYIDSYSFEGKEGQRVLITLESQAFDPYLILLDANGNSLSQNDDGGSASNAQIEYTLPTDGKYTIYANSYGGGGGAYSLSLKTATAQTSPPAAQAANLPRYFCDESGDVPQTMARRKDGVIDWLIQWTPDTAVSDFSTAERCRRVSNNLEQIHRTLGRDFQITTSRLDNRNVVCAANVRLTEGQVEYQRGECAPQGLILTAADSRGAIASAEALNTRIGLLNGAPPAPVAYAPPPDGEPIAVPYQFSFSTALSYSNCLEDIIQLYQDPNRLREQGRRGTCVPDVFAEYANGISKSQALELITAANNYATKPPNYPYIFPPRGQRLRIQQLFGFTYTVDQ